MGIFQRKKQAMMTSEGFRQDKDSQQLPVLPQSLGSEENAWVLKEEVTPHCCHQRAPSQL